MSRIDLSMKLSSALDNNIKVLDGAFADCGDVVGRKFALGHSAVERGDINNPKLNLFVYISYIDMLVDRDMIERHVVARLSERLFNSPPSLSMMRGYLFDPITDGGISTIDISEAETIGELCDAMMNGNMILMIQGYDKAFIISAQGWPSRGITTTESEVVVQGSKDAFTETFRMNTMLIRRRIKDVNLKIKQTVVGKRSKTNVALVYLDDVVRPKVLNELIRRIDKINIDAILDCGYIEQFIKEDWQSPFPQAQTTERPDKASAAVLEGRIVIIVDNSPYVLIVPATLNVFFQASEDYNQNWQIMSFTRLLRYIAAFMAIALPGLYIAVAAYHPSILPLELIIKIAKSRESVPFPVLIEVLIMEFAFELLREAGIRLPRPIGSTIGIVGGLIVGQAAVEAGLCSPIVVIVVAIAGISSFAIPHVSLVSGFRLMKYVITIFSALLGLLGLWIGLFIVFTHLVSLKSFGIPYLFPFASREMYDRSEYNGRRSDYKDTLLRMPLFMMKKRPVFANSEELIRYQGSEGEDNNA